MTDKCMNLEHWWTNTDRECSEGLGKYGFQCHFAHHKSHMDWPRMELSVDRNRPTTHSLSHGNAQGAE